MTWNPARLPDQSGRVFVVTGGNAGLGYFTVEQLAGTGARVILASRSQQRADAAIASVKERVPNADLGFVRLDLSSLDSVREVGEYLGGVDRLDGLVLNAGMTTGSVRRKTTADGNEFIVGVNYLGHFALTAGAIPALRRTAGSRVVGLGSISTRLVKVDLDDLQSTRRYEFFRAYAFSKHAMHGFILELDRRLRGADAEVESVLAHPGLALDGLTLRRPGIADPKAQTVAAERAIAGFAQGKNRGAASIVRALLDPHIAGGDSVGPRWLVRGRPVLEQPVASSASPAFGAGLWERSEKWTGTEFALTRSGSWPLHEHHD